MTVITVIDICQNLISSSGFGQSIQKCSESSTDTRTPPTSWVPPHVVFPYVQSTSLSGIFVLIVQIRRLEFDLRNYL